MSETISSDTIIGDHSVVSKIGEGGMGEVYRARDTKLGRYVAIKVLHAAFSEDSERLRRFNRMTGQTLSHYRIISKIGAGGMSEVYLAEDTRLERQLALKVLLDEIAYDEDCLRRFVQEAKAESALNHPNILTVHKIGHFENLRFIDTELIRGQIPGRILARTGS